MRHLPSHLLVLALLGPSGAMAAGAASYQGAELHLAVEGQDGGPLASFDGWAIRSSLVSQATGADGVTKQTIGPPRYGDLKLRLPLPVKAATGDWIRGFLLGQGQARGGAVLELAHGQPPRRTLAFTGATIERLTFCPFDSQASKVSAYVDLTLRPAQVQETAGGTMPPSGPTGPAASAKGRPASANFALALGSLPSAAVLGIGPITVARKDGGGLELPPFPVTLRSSQGGPWVAWAQDFVVAGNSADQHELQGEISLLDPTLKNVLFRVQLVNVGAAGLGGMAGEAARDGMTGKDMATPKLVELYCERVGFDEASALAVAPAALAGATAATPGAPTGAATAPLDAASSGGDSQPGSPGERPTETGGHPDDQGARDPADYPRCDGCIRQSFSSQRYKTSLDERASYVCKGNPEEVEAFFAKALGGAGWEETSRSESGSVKEGSYLIDFRLKRENRTSWISIGVAKDQTKVSMINLSTFPAK